MDEEHKARIGEGVRRAAAARTDEERNAIGVKIGDALRGRQRPAESVVKAWEARKGNLRNIGKPKVLARNCGSVGVPFKIQPDGHIETTAVEWDFLSHLHSLHNWTRETLIFTVQDGWITIWGYRSFSKTRQVRMFKQRLETTPFAVTFNVGGEIHTLEGLRAYWPHQTPESR